MNVNAGSPNVVSEAVARTEAIVDKMRGKFLDWLRTIEGTLKGYLSTLETGRIQMCSEVQAVTADAVVAGSRMKNKRSRRHVVGLS
jgi:hypothetical protein